MNVGIVQMEPGLRRLTAANSSPMTFRGTNTYLLGKGSVAVIDPGPEDPVHLDALLGATAGGERISHILVTHSHLDHSPLARALAAIADAPVLAFGTHTDGRSPRMRQLARTGLAGGGEGADTAFAPDLRLEDGAIVTGDGWTVEALHTPGHTANHMCFAWNGALFTGDLVMGWASSIISPPDGDLTAFMTSCKRLAGRRDHILYPGHGEPVTDPAGRIAWLIAHRRSRERQILAALGETPEDIPTLTRRVYSDIPPALLAAAERNLLAHLIDLCERGKAAVIGELSSESLFRGIE
ncbi:MBL fold metallo-hydrolase [Tropicimonas sp.]|uniref:MBL fold metallo-hydrolase n=1 Tax=Tropicimonas sp. TaxID=2067044 RepID=UPI003A8BC8EF